MEKIERNLPEAYKIRIATLTDIVRILKYANICLHPYDVDLFTSVPWIKRDFYSAHWKYKRASVNGRRGFLNNGHTVVWEDHLMTEGYIKIAERTPTNETIGWSEPFSIGNEGDILKVHKYMKLKAFW